MTIVRKKSYLKTAQLQKLAYVDDDNIASYYLTLGTDPSYVRGDFKHFEAGEVIAGPRGTTLSLAIQSSIELNSSSYLFTQLGGTTTIDGDSGLGTVMYIDTTLLEFRVQPQALRSIYQSDLLRNRGKKIATIFKTIS